jgi:hypothetical protein
VASPPPRPAASPSTHIIIDDGDDDEDADVEGAGGEVDDGEMIDEDGEDGDGDDQAGDCRQVPFRQFQLAQAAAGRQGMQRQREMRKRRSAEGAAGRERQRRMKAEERLAMITPRNPPRPQVGGDAVRSGEQQDREAGRANIVGTGLQNKERHLHGERHPDADVWAAAHMRRPSTAAYSAGREVLAEGPDGFKMMSVRTIHRRTRSERDFYAENLTRDDLSGIPEIIKALNATYHVKPGVWHACNLMVDATSSTKTGMIVECRQVREFRGRGRGVRAAPTTCRFRMPPGRSRLRGRDAGGRWVVSMVGRFEFLYVNNATKPAERGAA